MIRADLPGLTKEDVEVVMEEGSLILRGERKEETEIDFPAPVAHHAGPELTAAVGGMNPGQIASSIVAPSHEVGPEARGMMEGELSPMGDFADAMTVRQLIDLVAYLDSLA